MAAFKGDVTGAASGVTRSGSAAGFGAMESGLAFGSGAAGSSVRVGATEVGVRVVHACETEAIETAAMWRDGSMVQQARDAPGYSAGADSRVR